MAWRSGLRRRVSVNWRVSLRMFRRRFRNNVGSAMRTEWINGPHGGPYTMTASAPVQRQFPCKQCGASLEYAPGTQEVVCKYCGAVNRIPDAQTRVEEEDFRSALARLSSQEPTH